MKYLFDVAFLPTESLKIHDCRIVVDLLRMSTQIVTFFDLGGEILIPVKEVSESFSLKEKLKEQWKLMGEREGLPVPGFDFGNSPTELSLHSPFKNAIITTSNGTQALIKAAKDCQETFVACARNAEAVAWEALCTGPRIGILAAGQNGEFSMEDAVCAGMLIEKMLKLAPLNGAEEMKLTDGAIAAMALWRSFGPNILKVAMESEHGLILQQLGFADDLVFCSEIDVTATVPKLKNIDGLLQLIAR